ICSEIRYNLRHSAARLPPGKSAPVNDFRKVGVRLTGCLRHRRPCWRNALIVWCSRRCGGDRPRAAQRKQTRFSVMSDYDRNVADADYGRRLTRAEAAVVDAGLRAYMLRIYNYMVLGLAITGFAALGAYMISVTGDAASAAKTATGAALTLRPGSGLYLTPIGHA